MTAAGAFVQFGGCYGAIEAGGDKVFVKVGVGRDGNVRQPRNQNVLILVLPDGQIMGVWCKKIQNLRKGSTDETHKTEKKKQRRYPVTASIHLRYINSQTC